MNDLISVIVPVYKVEKYLRKCVDSIINQTYRNLEIILVDDGSPDNSGAICDEYASKDERIKVIHKENGGVASARNEGMMKAVGDYIAFIDADDLVDKRYFEVLTSDVEKYKADIVCCDCIELEGDYDGAEIGRFHNVKKSRIIKYLEQYYKDFKSKEEFYGYVVWGKLIKRELAVSVLFDNIKYGEDLLYMFKIFEKNPITYLDAYRGYYYIRWDDSATMRNGALNVKRAVDYIYIMQQKLDIIQSSADEKLVCDAVRDYANSIYSYLSIIIRTDDKKTYDVEKQRIDKYIDDCIRHRCISLKYRILLGFYKLNSEWYWRIIKTIINIKRGIET